MKITTIHHIKKIVKTKIQIHTIIMILKIMKNKYLKTNIIILAIKINQITCQITIK